MDCYQEFINFLKSLSTRPKLLLHSCCGPCSTHVLDLLKQYFDISVLYFNPNIYPLEEYQLRLFNQQKVINLIDQNIQLIPGDYDYQLFINQIRGYEKMGERSIRCFKCYEFRLKYVSEFAIEHGFGYFTTTLSISPYKNSDWLNEIGFKYSSPKSQYLYSNFKKNGGYQNSIRLSKQYNIYRQEYCGCEFSQLEQKELGKNTPK